MRRLRKVLLAVFAVSLLLGLTVAVTACSSKRPETHPVTQPIDYVITVECADEEVLANVKVQLFSGEFAASEPKSLDSAHKATFSLEPGSYTVKLSGVDGYTYPTTTVSQSKPSATVTLTAAIATYAVTYAGGAYGSTAYAGTSVIPTEGEKAENEKFDLAAALVWSGYVFKGWHDGTTTYAAGAEYTMTAGPVTFTAQWEAEPSSYAVTYSSARCNGVDYAGEALPADTEKTEKTKFNLPAAPVWADHTFMGWSDGVNTYAANAEYTMPSKAVNFTATWMSYVELINYDVPTWNEGATTGGFEILKGQQITISACIYKETGDSAYGLLAKIFPNSVRNNDYFYQFRCDFVIKRNNWSWSENNDGFNVVDGGFVRNTYRDTDEGNTEITVALSEDGVLTYTFGYQATWLGEVREGDYSHRRIFTDTVKMDSAVVIFGYDHASTQPSGSRVHLTYPDSDAVLVTLDTVCDDSDWSTVYGGPIRRYAVTGNTFTINDYNPDRTGYAFLGWQVGGTGEYYVKDGVVSIGRDSITLRAAWRQTVTFSINKNGAERNPSVKSPAYRFDEETGKYIIGEATNGLPVFNEFTITKSGYRYDGWDVLVNGEPIEVVGPFSVDPGANISYTIRWAKTYYVSYQYGSCDGKNYDGTTPKPETTYKAAGDDVVITYAIVWNGYIFLGWSDDGGVTLYQPDEIYTMPAHNVTFTAQWRKIESGTDDATGTESLPMQATAFGAVDMALAPEKKRA